MRVAELPPLLLYCLYLAATDFAFQRCRFDFDVDIIDHAASVYRLGYTCWAAEESYNLGEIELAANLIEFEGFAPSGNSRRLIRIPMAALLKHLQDTGNEAMYNEAWLIPDVCIGPSGVWRNLQRGGQEEAFCYAGRASGSFAAKYGKQIASPAGQVLMVFLTKDLEVTKWRHCLEDPVRAGFPVGHEDRFGERLWPKD